jgi:hypothetical protein
MSGNSAVQKRTATCMCWELRRIDKKISSTYSVPVSSQASSPLIHKPLTPKSRRWEITVPVVNVTDGSWRCGVERSKVDEMDQEMTLKERG